jgi:N-formylglutamate amidohydrolase
LRRRRAHARACSARGAPLLAAARVASARDVRAGALGRGGAPPAFFVRDTSGACYTERVRGFELTLPEQGVRPLLVEVPHAGLQLPESVRSELVAPEDAMRRDADIYVDALYANAPSLGASLLVANVSRYVVDLNRAQDDVDAGTVSGHPSAGNAQPRGVVWRSTTDGRPILSRPLTYAQLLARLNQYYAPYHAALRNTLDALRARFGYVILLAGHSMPSMGRSMHTDPGARRADIVPGTCGRTSADRRLIELVDVHFRSAGLSVRHDDPYRGGFTTSHYGRPREHCHAIQIELNRALYVDEQTTKIKEPEFRALQRLLDQLLEKLGSFELR